MTGPDHDTAGSLRDRPDAEPPEALVRFSDLVGVNERPTQPQPADRRPLVTIDPGPRLSDDPANSGFVAALGDRRRARRLGATRRGFLRSALIAAGAAAATSVTGAFGAARRVEAQTGVIGTYPRRILTFCPPYNANDNCQPGCGSSPICTDCCGRDGFFRNDPANGYSLYPGGCGDGDIADGWLWRFNGVCGNCASIEYRCSDGYVQTDTGPAPFICRWVTDCEPLPEGVAPGVGPDAAVQTNWRPAGALESAVDNGGSVTINGWIADVTRLPVDLRITANGQIVHIGKAALARPDIAAAVRGAGPNTGYAVTFPLEVGDYRICVDALNGASTSTIGCVNLAAGSGQVVRGSIASTTIAGADSPPATASATPEPTPDEPDDGEAPDEESGDAPEGGRFVLPDPSDPTDSPTHGAVQVIRRAGATTGFVSGWAGDADTDEAPYVEVLVEDAPAALVRPELPRPDVELAFPELGSNTGFAVSFELPESESEICVEVIDPQDGRRRPLGCRTVGTAVEAAVDAAADAATDDQEQPPSGPPTVTGDPEDPADVVWGAVDDVDVDAGLVTVRGWAHAPNASDVAVDVVVSASGASAAGATGLAHEVARERYGIDAPCGFEIGLELGPGEHTIRVAASAGGSAVTLHESTVSVA